ncbi:nuclear transport factor 2 family protein [Duganella sp. CT11-25]|uniref:nuclear transport factor 2 family protein n=1 Tax=unclassified Duganella TaxID=2636909 RepID=UPI0039B0326B
MHRLLAALLLLPVLASAAQNTPDETVSELWRALSNDPGASANVAALKRLFHPDAVVFGVRYKDEVASIRRTAIADFLSSQEPASDKGFYECEVAREVKVYDRFAVVYSVVESRRDKAAIHPTLVGSNSIQLYKAGAEWKILSLYYQVEKQGQPIPLGDGQPGKCLT